MNWYAIKTQNNQERSVLEKLKSESGNLIGKSIIPTERIYSVKEDGKRIARDKIVYPGYVFVETSAVSEVSNVLKHITGCTGFVKNKSGEVSPLREDEIDSMISVRNNTNSNKLTEIDFIIGERVTVTGGPFETFKGSITDLDMGKKKAKLNISIFNRPTSVDVGLNQIKRTPNE